ncbi:MAG: hypothetical protein LBF58_01915 [Deltaproteobacteria bacterium]|nr:hypothetical protein [Deltaproteobacteria bacterium]
MTYPPPIDPPRGQADLRRGEDGWDMGQSAADVSRFLTGHAPVDKRGLMALAREIGKNLADFKAPAGYAVKPAPEGAPLPPVAAKALGAASLRDFFYRLPSPPGQSPEPYPPLANLPRGLDDLDWAIKVVDAAYEESSRAAMIDPRRQSRRRTELVTAKASLIRARQMADQFWAMLEAWSDESRATFREAQDLADSIKRFMGSPEGLGAQGVGYGPTGYGATGYGSPGSGGPDYMSDDYRGSSLTGAAADLSARLRRIREAFSDRLLWREDLKAIQGEIETLTAAASNDRDIEANLSRFWQPTVKALNARLVSLDEGHGKLAAAAMGATREVAAGLAALEGAEEVLLGQTGTDLKKRSELLTIKVESVIRDAVSLCQELKDFWRVLPSLVGKPRRVEKILTSIAAHYGKTLSVGEELRGNLARFTGRLSNTSEVRAKARKALAVRDRAMEDKASVGRARARLATLGHLILYKTSSEYHRGLAETRKRDIEESREREDALNLILENKNEEIAALRASLTSLPSSGRPDAATLERLSAVLNERDRLEDHLSQARVRLTSMGMFKAQILKTVERARLALNKAIHDRDELEASRRKLESEMNSVKRRYSRLAQYYVRDRKKIAELEEKYAELAKNHQVGREEAKFFLEERARQNAALKTLDSEIKDLKTDYANLKAGKAENEEAIQALKAQEATLRAEISAKTDEFREVGQSRERLAQLVSGLRTQLDRLTMARNALKASWDRRGKLLAESEAEKDSLRLRLDRQKRNLITLVTKRQKLLSEMGNQRLRLDGFERERERLLAEIEEAKGGTQETERLTGELERLRGEIDGNLKPLVEVLTMALWRAQAHLNATRETVDKKLSDQGREFQAKEADIRIAVAAKEIDYLKLLSARQKETESLKSERDALAEELEAVRRGAPEGDAESARNSWLTHQLSLALSAASIKQERLSRSVRDFRLLFDKQKEESEAIKTELNEMIQNQAKALSDHKAWLGELVPLVRFFLEGGRAYWAGQGQEDAREAVLFFMAKENAELAEELSSVKGERQSLFAERQSYLALNDKVRARLAELQPLVEFLVASFFQTTASLAQVTLERQELQKKIALYSDRAADVGYEAYPPAGPIPAGTQNAPMSPETARARREVKRLANENSRLAQNVALNEAALAEAKAKITDLERNSGLLQDSLNQSQRDLAEARSTTDVLHHDKAQLVGLLEDHEIQLNLARTEAGRLSLELSESKSQAAKAAAELADFQARLAEAENAPPAADGKLEAAWAALTYVNSKAGDAMNNLQAKLDKQAWELEAAFEEMKKRDEEIKTLKESQDRLSLMWWTIFSLASDGQPSLSQKAEQAEDEAASQATDGLDLEGLPGLGDLDFNALDESQPQPAEATPETPAPESPGAGAAPEPGQAAEATAEGDADGKKEQLGGSLLAELRKAARRALFTLFLAGMAFFPAKMALAEDPILLGSPETPIVSDFMPDSFDSPIVPGLTCVPSNYLGRNMDLGVVTSSELALGPAKAEERAQEMISSQANRWGFPEEGYLRLVRLAYGREAKVNLAELEGDLAPAKLLKPHLPTLAKAMADSGTLPTLAPPVMAAVLDFTPLEGPFWERFFTRLRHKLKDDGEAASAMAWHLATRQRRMGRLGVDDPDDPQNKTAFPRKGFYLDYAGVMAPFHSLENMPFEQAATFLESFISKTWGRDYSRAKKRGAITRPLPKGNEPKRLASDLLQVAHLSRLPRTLMVAMLNADFNASGLWPSTLELYGWGQRLTDLLYTQSAAWSPSQPRLLDFDLLYEYLSSVAKSNDLQKCHVRLHAYLFEALSQKPDLLGLPRRGPRNGGQSQG